MRTHKESPHSHDTFSTWKKDVVFPLLSSLDENLVCDVCIVGGGLAGLTSAYLLRQSGKSVVVLEGDEIGWGQTAQSTAQLSNIPDARYTQIEKIHGVQNARLVYESYEAALAQIERIIVDEKIDCDFEEVKAYLFTDREDSSQAILSELKALQKIDFPGMELSARAPISTFDTGLCLMIPHQRQIHSLKYLRGLLEAVLNSGVKVYTQTQVSEVKEGKISQIKCGDRFEVKANTLIIATNAPINNTISIHTKQAPYRTYVVGFEIPKGSVPRALFWDTLEPFHYVRIAQLDDNKELLLVGGEDHKTGQNKHPDHCFDRLIEWTRERFQMAGNVVYQWSGQVLQSIDELAFLGKNAGSHDNVFVITGDSGTGFTHGTLGAMIIADHINKVPNPWEKLYDPSRMPVKSLTSFVSENVNVAFQYIDWLSVPPSEQEALEALPIGEGMIVSKNQRKVAVYKGENNQCEFYSAACPHMGGMVHWNTVEKSWDCPCHGSRFDAHGRVIEGPAHRDLSPVEPKVADPTELKLIEEQRHHFTFSLENP